MVRCQQEVKRRMKFVLCRLRDSQVCSVVLFYFYSVLFLTVAFFLELGCSGVLT